MDKELLHGHLNMPNANVMSWFDIGCVSQDNAYSFALNVPSYIFTKQISFYCYYKKPRSFIGFRSSIVNYSKVRSQAKPHTS